ncbi:hypothetical protein ES703_70493 [subsurface metagenome]
MVELLVVIAIIALLMGILLPVLRSAKEQARKVVCLAHVKSLITGVHVYATDHDDNIPASIDGMNASWNFICWQTYDKPPRWVNLGRLYGTKIITDPEIFYCPSQRNKILQNTSPDEDGIGWTWISPTGNEERAISYMYGLLAEIRSMPELELESLKLSDLKTRALICDAFLPFKEGPVWAHPKGLSTGFGAGHVEFIKVDKEVIDAADHFDLLDQRSAQVRDQMDLFVAAMFELLAGKNQVMDEHFLH